MVDGKLVTVLGGGGFVGRYVVQHLLESGARVRIAQRDPRQAFFLKPLGGLGQTQFLRADVRDAASVARAVAGSDAVVNLAGAFADMEAVQARGAAHVAQAAVAAGAERLVHLSAIGADCASASAYGRSKGEGEAAVRAAFPDATILRPSIVFGREDQFVNRFANLVRRLPIVPIIAPDTRFQPVFAGDVGAAVLAALRDGGAARATFELGGPEQVTMAALLAWIARRIGRRPWFVAVPDPLAALLAKGFGWLPGAPITHDQWLMLQRDNVVADDARTLADLGITPVSLDRVAEGWLVLYRRHGRFAAALAD